MPRFSKYSLTRLNTCDERLQAICHEAIKLYDFRVLWGKRTEEQQNYMVMRGVSKLEYPKSKHNRNPSQAVDIVPWPIDWDDHGRFKFLAGIMFAIAQNKEIKLRWGGDWDGDTDFTDQDFNDLGHFELI